MKHHIHHFIPYDPDGNLGTAISAQFCIELLGLDYIINGESKDLELDISCLFFAIQDADVMILTPRYQHLWNECIERYPDTAIFTCKTNRVMNGQQLVNGYLDDDHDGMKHHRKIALDLYEKHGTTCTELFRPISGFFMLINGRVFREHTDVLINHKGLLGLDTALSDAVLKKGGKIRVMEGMYCMHYYRFNEGIDNISHLKI